MKSYRGWRRWIPKKETKPAAPEEVAAGETKV